MKRGYLNIRGWAGSFLIPAFVFIVSAGMAQDVDPLTGRAVLSVPLGEIGVLDLKIPVELSHHGGALKVDETPGSAGMGWNFSGWAITQEVRGLPDNLNGFATDTRRGWLYNNNAQRIQNFTPSSDDNLGECSDESTDYGFVNSTLTPSNDPEPDVYAFNAPGISGKFVLGADGQPRLIPYQDLQIIVGSGYFDIKTNTGLVYRFSEVEQWTRLSKSSESVFFFRHAYLYSMSTIAWYSYKLSRITSTRTGAVVNFTYQQGEQKIAKKYFPVVYPDNHYDTSFYHLEKVTPKQLTRMAIKGYAVDFAWANSVVKHVTFSETESGETKEYELVYKSIVYMRDYQHHIQDVRPFLMQIKQRNSCSSFPAYKFTYTGVDTVRDKCRASNTDGKAQDYFGYYNGKRQNKNIPAIYFYQSESGARRLRVTPIPGVTPTVALAAEANQGMAVDPDSVTYGAVSRIDYPSGAVTTIAYEANTYLDTSTGEVLFGPGVRVSRITSSAGELAFGKTDESPSNFHALVRSYQYMAADGSTVSSGRILYPPILAFTSGETVYRSKFNLTPDNDVLYERVKEVTPGKGSRVFQFFLPNMYPDATSAATTSKVVRQGFGTCTIGYWKNGSYTWPYAPLTDLDYRRGFLRRLSEYSETGDLVRTRRVSYSFPQASSVVKGLKIESIVRSSDNTTSYQYSLYEIPVNQSCVLAKDVVTQISDQSAADSARVTTTYVYNGKNMVTQSTQTGDDNAVLQSNIRYAMDYNITSPATGDVAANGLYQLNLNNCYGQVIETYKTYTPPGGTPSTRQGKVDLYKHYGGTVVMPYQQKDFPAGAAFTPAAVSTGASQTFVPDGDYILNSAMEYTDGLMTNMTDRSMIPTSTHYASNLGIPLVSFVNCKAEHAVQDGFEFSKNGGLSVVGTGSLNYPAGWTGYKSIELRPFVFSLTSGTITKNENSYRIACWVYADQATTLTINAKNGSTVQSTLALNYTAIGKWTYLEGLMDMTSVSSSFTIEIKTSALVRIDDFVALPRSARVSSQTFKPFNGVTSSSDDRGRSTVITYDVMGRKSATLDYQRNLVELQEYGLQRLGRTSLNPNFTTNVTEYYAGQTITFTADVNCLPQMTYAWTFTDPAGNSTTASGSPVNKKFFSYGVHNVTLQVSSPGYGTASFTQNICVFLPADVTSFLHVSVSPSSVVDRCSPTDDGKRTFHAFLTGIDTDGLEISYSWARTNINGTFTGSGSGDDDSVTINFPGFGYQVRCIVEISIKADGEAKCNSDPATGTQFNGISYINAPPASCP